jgi:hypothetical protein
VRDGRIDSGDLKNGILMLQTALWREYQDVRIEHHDDHRYTTHAACKRCGASWSGDSLTQPDRHERWCPLAWTPDLKARRATADPAQAAPASEQEQGR